MKKRLAALAMVTLALSGCAQLLRGAIIQAQAAQPISTEQEIAIGNAAAERLLSNPEVQLYQGEQVTAYVARIGKGIADLTPRKTLPWSFQVLESKDKNALSLPGGKIYITTGSLQAMENEAQLAGVLAHEIAHITQRHGIDQVKRAMVAQGILVSTLGTSPRAAQVAGIIAAEIVLRGYGRDAEYDADRQGAIYASQANYDPRALIRFLQLLGSGEAPGWLTPIETHPPINDRIKRLNLQIAESRLPGNVLNTAQYKASTAPLKTSASLLRVGRK